MQWPHGVVYRAGKIAIGLGAPAWAKWNQAQKADRMTRRIVECLRARGVGHEAEAEDYLKFIVLGGTEI